MRFMRDLGTNHEITNVNGGAIAMGDPLGATGATILGTLVDELARRDEKARPRHAVRRRRHGHREPSSSGLTRPRRADACAIPPTLPLPAGRGSPVATVRSVHDKLSLDYPPPHPMTAEKDLR